MAPPVVTALNALAPPEGQGVRGQVRSRPLHSALDALVAYVPLALMVGLAGASFWLLRVTPTFEVSAPSAVRSNVPDDYLVNFVSRSFNEAGQLTAEVFGDTGTHVPATGNMLITNPRIRSWGDGAAITVGRAKRALIDDGQTVYELTGNAVVTHIRPNRETGGYRGRAPTYGHGHRHTQSLNAIARDQRQRCRDWRQHGLPERDGHYGVAGARTRRFSATHPIKNRLTRGVSRFQSERHEGAGSIRA